MSGVSLHSAMLPTNSAPPLLDLFKPYTARPAWKVAGVDYPVGRTSSALTPWWQAKSSGIASVNTFNGRIDVAGKVFLEGIDFSATSPDGCVGSWVYCTMDDTAIAMQDCLMGLSPRPVFACVIVQAARASLSIEATNMVGGTPDQSTFVSFAADGSCSLMRNRCTGGNQHVAEVSGSVQFAQAKNVIDNMTTGAGSHENWCQWGKILPGASSVSVFNTCLKTMIYPGVAGGEGFQTYANLDSAAAVLDTGEVSNNTIITSGTGLLANAIHPGRVRNGVIADNWHDIAGTGVNFPSGGNLIYQGEEYAQRMGWKVYGNTRLVRRNVTAAGPA